MPNQKSLAAKAKEAKLRKGRQDEAVRLARKGLNYRQIAASVGVKETTLRRWRKENPAFADSLESARATYDNKTTEALKKNETTIAMPPEERAKIFVEVYAVTHSRVESMQAAGITTHDYEQMIDPESKDYDPEFSEAMSEEMRKLKFQIVDNLYRRALKDNTAAKEVLGKLTPKDKDQAQPKTTSSVDPERGKKLLQGFMNRVAAN